MDASDRRTFPRKINEPFPPKIDEPPAQWSRGLAGAICNAG
jgi:hypothetical protein